MSLPGEGAFDARLGAWRRPGEYGFYDENGNPFGMLRGESWVRRGHTRAPDETEVLDGSTIMFTKTWHVWLDEDMVGTAPTVRMANGYRAPVAFRMNMPVRIYMHLVTQRFEVVEAGPTTIEAFVWLPRQQTR